MSLVDKRRGGPLERVGERDSTPCDTLSGQERRALPCARMRTAVCIVGVRCAFAAVEKMVAALCSAVNASVAWAE